MRRDEGEKAQLRALVEGGIVADGGRREENQATERVNAKAA
jgi:hypothetical protein